MCISTASWSILIEKLSGSSTDIEAFRVERRSIDSPRSTRTASCAAISSTSEAIAMDAPAKETNDERTVRIRSGAYSGVV